MSPRLLLWRNFSLRVMACKYEDPDWMADAELSKVLAEDKPIFRRFPTVKQLLYITGLERAATAVAPPRAFLSKPEWDAAVKKLEQLKKAKDR